MNELAIRGADLPALPMEDIKQYVDVIGDAIDALKAKRNAAGHLNVDKAVVDEMDAQIREYSAMKLRAEMELGKKTAAMPKSAGNRFTVENPRHGLSTTPKKQALKNIDLTPQRASDMERMAKHEEVVNRYIDHQLSIGETPTRAGAFRKIAETAPKPKTPKQAAEEHIKEIKAAPIASIQDATILREEQTVIENATVTEVMNAIHQINVRIFHYYDKDLGGGDFETFIKNADDAKKKRMTEMLNMICGCAMKLRNQVEVSK